MHRFLTAGLGLVLMSSGALADGHSTSGPRVYPVHGVENYCPTGLQPVTISGVICCGTPNQKMSYQHALAHGHPKRARVHRVRSKSADCPIGTKGCTFD